MTENIKANDAPANKALIQDLPGTTVPAKASILVVDDEPHVGGLICEWLILDGYVCDSTTSGVAALKLFQQNKYDLLITDISMPDVSGMDLLEQARKTDPDIAVVMATGVDDRDTANKALNLGADGYAIKPFNMNEFLINIANILEKKRLSLERLNHMESLEKQVRDRTLDVCRREEEIVLRLISATGHRSDEVGEHIKRMGLYCVVMAKALGWDQELIDLIKVGAPMHDVGKIGIPDNVLLKPGRLSSEELAVIREHPVIGADILSGSDIPLLQMAADIALYHHERWDGTGYPSGLSGEDIPEAARVVSIIDVYDSLCHDRVYRKSYKEADAIALMDQKRGTHFDPEMYDCFREKLPSIRRIRQECKAGSA